MKEATELAFGLYLIKFCAMNSKYFGIGVGINVGVKIFRHEGSNKARFDNFPSDDNELMEMVK